MGGGELGKGEEPRVKGSVKWIVQTTWYILVRD